MGIPGEEAGCARFSIAALQDDMPVGALRSNGADLSFRNPSRRPAQFRLSLFKGLQPRIFLHRAGRGPRSLPYLLQVDHQFLERQKILKLGHPYGLADDGWLIARFHPANGPPAVVRDPGGGVRAVKVGKVFFSKMGAGRTVNDQGIRVLKDAPAPRDSSGRQLAKLFRRLRIAGFVPFVIEHGQPVWRQPGQFPRQPDFNYHTHHQGEYVVHVFMAEP